MAFVTPVRKYLNQIRQALGLKPSLFGGRRENRPSLERIIELRWKILCCLTDSLDGDGICVSA